MLYSYKRNAHITAIGASISIELCNKNIFVFFFRAIFCEIKNVKPLHPIAQMIH